MGSKVGHIIRRAGGSWRVVLCVDGKVHQFGPRTEPELSADTEKKKDVELWAMRKVQELHKTAARERSGLPGRIRFSELLRQYRDEKLPTKAATTQRAYEVSLKPSEFYFVEKLGDPFLDQVRRAHLEQYLSWRRTHGPDGGVIAKSLSARSLAKDRAVLHSLFGFADSLELRDGNPVQRVAKPKGDAKQAVILSTKQFDALVAACEDPMVKLYVITLAETGARDESETLWIQWGDVTFEDSDFSNGYVTVVSGRDGHRTKSGKSRKVPLTSRMKAALKDHFAAYRFMSECPWIFYHTRTRRHHLRGQRVGSFRAAVAKAVKRANDALLLENHTPIPTEWVMHDLRHRRVTTWLAEGQKVTDVQYWMGHSSIETTMGYYHHVPKPLQEVEIASRKQETA